LGFENQGNTDRENLLTSHNSQLSSRSDGKEQNMNIRAAIVHILGDMVQSIGVISAALILKFKPEPEW
jgi:zinc transporter 2|tara:strand:+ start:314 stop:517 length:204 start_codon:yes stop_codon:yes gene_type:complete